jgi:hypothetical protein
MIHCTPHHAFLDDYHHSKFVLPSLFFTDIHVALSGYDIGHDKLRVNNSGIFATQV